MGLFYQSLATALAIYIWVLLARFALDLITGINPRFKPKGILLVLCEVAYTLSDPPLKFLRRFIKPLRFGTVSIDFGWTILFIAVSVLQDFLAAQVA